MVDTRFDKRSVYSYISFEFFTHCRFFTSLNCRVRDSRRVQLSIFWRILLQSKSERHSILMHCKPFQSQYFQVRVSVEAKFFYDMHAWSFKTRWRRNHLSTTWISRDTLTATGSTPQRIDSSTLIFSNLKASAALIEEDKNYDIKIFYDHDKKAYVDIVFVHELIGNAYNIWLDKKNGSTLIKQAFKIKHFEVTYSEFWIWCRCCQHMNSKVSVE